MSCKRTELMLTASRVGNKCHLSPRRKIEFIPTGARIYGKTRARTGSDMVATVNYHSSGSL